MSGPDLDRPWLRRADWASRRVQSNEERTRGASAAGLIFAFVWIGGLAGFAGLLLSLGVTQAAPYLFLAAFAAAILPVVAGSLQGSGSPRASVFEMKRVPAAPGGTLEGVVWVAASLRPDWGVKIALTCWQLSTSISTRRRFPPTVAWETDAVVDILPDSAPGETRVPIRIDIPATCAGAHPTRAPGGHFWELRIEGRSGSSAFHNSFEVPVFVTEETVAALQKGERFAERQPSASTTLVDHPEPGVTRYRFPFGSGTVFFTVVLPLLSPITLLLPFSTTTAIVVMLLLIGFGALVQFTESAGCEVTPQEIILRGGYRGWFRQQRFPLGEVRRVWLDDCMNGYKQVKIRTRGMQDADVSRVVSVMEGRWLAAELRATLTGVGASLED